MKDLCDKWKVKLFLERPTGCQEPGVLSVWKQWRRQPTEVWGKVERDLLGGQEDRSPPAGSGGRSLLEAETFSLKYMIILTLLIMKKCNMFGGGSGQRAVQGISCQFRT